MTDMSIIYATAHRIPDNFRERVFANLQTAAGPHEIIELHTTPDKASVRGYYTELLETARRLQTPYIAFAEDDTLYPDEHFNQRPSDMETFAFNFTRWNLYTWSDPPFYSLRQRRILGTLIAPRREFIKVMTERLKTRYDSQLWEPGRADGEKFETFETYNPIVVFSHPDSYGYDFSGTRKRANRIRATALPYWGTAKKIRSYYV